MKNLSIFAILAISLVSGLTLHNNEEGINFCQIESDKDTEKWPKNMPDLYDGKIVKNINGAEALKMFTT